MHSTPTMASQIHADDAVAANVAIINAFGLDANQCKSFNIELDSFRGPIVTAVMYRLNEAGEKFLEDGEAATVLKRFHLTECEDDPVEDQVTG